MNENNKYEAAPVAVGAAGAVRVADAAGAPGTASAATAAEVAAARPIGPLRTVSVSATTAGARAASAGASAAGRRCSAASQQSGLSTQDLILVAVLIAAGAVLKLTVSSFLSFAGMKPNFMIAMYCLAIILTRPKVFQSAIIGLLVGLVSQIPLLNATPLVNIASETLGALVCGVLVATLMKVAADNKAFQNVVAPVVVTFVSTVVSGYTFALIVGVAVAGLAPAAVFGVYAVMVFGTAVMNAALSAVLTPVLCAVLKR